jgi:hypothetical protein
LTPPSPERILAVGLVGIGLLTAVAAGASRIVVPCSALAGVFAAGALLITVRGARVSARD